MGTWRSVQFLLLLFVGAAVAIPWHSNSSESSSEESNESGEEMNMLVTMPTESSAEKSSEESNEIEGDTELDFDDASSEESKESGEEMTMNSTTSSKSSEEKSSEESDESEDDIDMEFVEKSLYSKDKALEENDEPENDFEMELGEPSSYLESNPEEEERSEVTDRGRRRWYYIFRRRRCWYNRKQCMNDMNCPKTQYCVKKSYLPYGCCNNRRATGWLCKLDNQCIGGFCAVFRCGECKGDGDCPSGKFCRNRNTPLMVKKCENKLADCKVCNRNMMCASGKCVNFVCCTNCTLNDTVVKNACEDDANCSSGEYCKYRDFPTIPSNCSAKLTNGSFCTRNEQCASGFCIGVRCSQCVKDGDCPQNNFCWIRNHLFCYNICRPKKCRGYCFRNNHCITGLCRRRHCRPCK